MIKISCSIGVCQYDSNSSINIDCLIGLADNAMYQAKRSGKNQFVIWSEKDLLDRNSLNHIYLYEQTKDIIFC